MRHITDWIFSVCMLWFIQLTQVTTQLTEMHFQWAQVYPGWYKECDRVLFGCFQVSQGPGQIRLQRYGRQRNGPEGPLIGDLENWARFCGGQKQCIYFNQASCVCSSECEWMSDRTFLKGPVLVLQSLGNRRLHIWLQQQCCSEGLNTLSPISFPWSKLLAYG